MPVYNIVAADQRLGEQFWSATLTVGASDNGTLGYLDGISFSSFGALSPLTFTREGVEHTVSGLFVTENKGSSG